MLLSTVISLIIGIVILLYVGFYTKNTERHWIVLGLSFLIGITMLGSLLLQGKEREKSLRVVGYATKNFESDLVKWNLSLGRNAEPGQLESTIGKVSADVAKFKSYLLEKGYQEDEIVLMPASWFQVTDNYGNPLHHKVQQSMVITSSRLDLTEEIALDPEVFTGLGLSYDNSNLGYFYTELPELKKTLLSEATSDALARAKEISSASGAGLGKIITARAGVFQITEPYSTDVSDYGIYSTNTRKKQISVTLTAEFQLR